jgi:glycosyltransferase involved in cell wall biosynthesis
VACSAFPPPSPGDIWGEINDSAYADWLLYRWADAILLTDLMTPTVVVPTVRAPLPPVLTVLYDLIPLLFPGHYLTSPVYLPHYVRRLRAMLASDAVLAISQSTVDDWMRMFGPDCPPAANIAGAVHGQFRLIDEKSLGVWKQALREKYGVEGEYLLYVGGPDYRKNLSGAVRAFAYLPSKRRATLKLVIACHLTDKERADVAACIRAAGVCGRVIVTGRVSDEELVALYHLCRLFVFPSLYEGLGLPILEALSCGCPVVCGDNSSLPEYAGPSTVLANANDPTAFARSIEAALAEPRDLRWAERLAFARRFTWEKTAERAARVIEQRVAARYDRRR